MATESLTPGLRETVEVLAEAGEPLSTPEVADRLDLGRRSTYARLDRLVDADRIRTKKVGAGARVWWIGRTVVDAPRSREDESATAGRTARDSVGRRGPPDDRSVGPVGLRETTDAELEQILDRITHGFYALDEDLRFGYVNAHARELLGLDDASIGTDIREGVDLTDPFEAALLEARDSQRPVELEDYYEPADAWFYNAIYPSESGITVGFRDITERKERVQQIERYAAMLDAIGEPVYELDTEGRLAYVNETLIEHTGYEEAELLGEHVSLVMREEAIARAEDHIRSLLEDEERRNAKMEFEIVPKDGDPFPVENRFSLMTDDDGRVTGSAGMWWDISERKENERALRESEARFRDLFTAMTEGYSVLEKVDTPQGEPTDFRYLRANPAFEDHTGTGDVVGRTVREVTPDEPQEWIDIGIQVIRTGEPTTFEQALPTIGRTLECTAFPVGTADDDHVGVIFSDVTERIEHTRRLEAQARMQEAVADLGRRALEGGDLDDLMARTAERLADTLDADVAGILELVDDIDTDADAVVDSKHGTDDPAERFHLRHGVGWKDESVGATTIPADVSDSPVAFSLDADGPVVVDDLTTDARFQGSGLPSDHDVRGAVCTVVGSFDEPWGVLCAHDAEPRTFTEPEVNFVQSVANVLATAIDRHRSDRELRRRNEALTVLHDLNEVVNDITDTVIDKSTRAEIEQAVCDDLAASDAYEFAWIAGVDPSSELLEPRAAAGTGRYEHEISVSIDPTDPEGAGPGGKAFRSRETQVVRDVFADPAFEPWREKAREFGFRAAASIPIVHEQTAYGVLAVYTDRQNAFDEAEANVLGHLGEVVGHAIASAEQRRALMSDELVELDVMLRDAFDDDRTEGLDGPITVDRTIPAGDDTFLMFATVPEDSLAALSDFVAATSSFEQVSVLERGDPTKVELRVADLSLLSTISAFGGYVDGAVFDSGDVRLTIHVAPNVEVRTLLDTLDAEFRRAELLGRRQIARSRHDDGRRHRHLLAGLTDRQRAALEAAHHAGYFQWPRDATADQLAESFEVAPSTYHQHLRAAERKVFDGLFSGDRESMEESVQ